MLVNVQIIKIRIMSQNPSSNFVQIVPKFFNPKIRASFSKEMSHFRSKLCMIHRNLTFLDRNWLFSLILFRNYPWSGDFAEKERYGFLTVLKLPSKFLYGISRKFLLLTFSKMNIFLNFCDITCLFRYFYLTVTMITWSKKNILNNCKLQRYVVWIRSLTLQS